MISKKDENEQSKLPVPIKLNINADLVADIGDNKLTNPEDKQEESRVNEKGKKREKTDSEIQDGMKEI